MRKDSLFKTAKSVNTKKIIAVALISALSLANAFFAVFLFKSFSFSEKALYALSFLCCVLFVIACGLGIYGLFSGKEVLSRAVIISLILSLFIIGSLCAVYSTGLYERVSSVKELREFVASLGADAVLFMLAFLFLQVVILPVPGFAAVGAAVALFGPFKGAVVSFIGILSGSFVAFFIGRSFGYKAASWVVGKKSLDKTLQSVKGKDKVVLTVMFLFPFFPDDVLCFVAGLSTMSNRYFAVMITLTRAISVFTTAYSIDGSVIPYDTPQGLIVWAIILIAVAAASFFIYKKGETIEKKFTEIFKKKNKKDA